MAFASLHMGATPRASCLPLMNASLGSDCLWQSDWRLSLHVLDCIISSLWLDLLLRYHLHSSLWNWLWCQSVLQALKGRSSILLEDVAVCLSFIELLVCSPSVNHQFLHCSLGICQSSFAGLLGTPSSLEGFSTSLLCLDGLLQSQLSISHGISSLLLSSLFLVDDGVLRLDQLVDGLVKLGNSHHVKVSSLVNRLHEGGAKHQQHRFITHIAQVSELRHKHLRICCQVVCRNFPLLQRRNAINEALELCLLLGCQLVLLITQFLCSLGVFHGCACCTECQSSLGKTLGLACKSVAVILALEFRAWHSRL